MPNWTQWIDTEDQPKRSSNKPNKNIFCRRNRQGRDYGPHVYDEQNICKLCGRNKNKSNYTITKEQEDDE
jgi:hypothetical protein